MNVQNLHIGAGAISLNGTDIGATTEAGAVISYEPDLHEHKTGKFGSTTVKVSYKGAKLTVKVFMSETTKENAARVMAGVTLDGGKLKFGGIAGREITGVPLVITPFDGTAPYRFRDAVAIGPIEVAYSSQDERVYEAEFTALADTSAPDNENLGYQS